MVLVLDIENIKTQLKDIIFNNLNNNKITSIIENLVNEIITYTITDIFFIYKEKNIVELYKENILHKEYSENYYFRNGDVEYDYTEFAIIVLDIEDDYVIAKQLVKVLKSFAINIERILSNIDNKLLHYGIIKCIIDGNILTINIDNDIRAIRYEESIRYKKLKELNDE